MINPGSTQNILTLIWQVLEKESEYTLQNKQSAQKQVNYTLTMV